MADTGTNILFNRLKDEIQQLRKDMPQTIDTALKIPREEGYFRLHVKSDGSFEWVADTE